MTAADSARDERRECRTFAGPDRCGIRPVERNRPTAQTARMAKKPEPTKPISWNLYKIANKAIRLGTIEAPDEATASEKAAAEFKVPAARLMAIRR
jgi:hypothetical protein